MGMWKVLAKGELARAGGFREGLDDDRSESLLLRDLHHLHRGHD